MNSIVKVISTQEEAETRRLIKVLGLGKEDVQEHFQVSSFGDDSNPVKDMVAIYAETNDIGHPVIIGYINKNQIADVGEKRIFSTDIDGNVVFYLHLKNDGTAEFGGDSRHMVRYEELESAFNQLKSDFNSHVAAYNSHVHPFVGLAAGVPGVTVVTTSAANPSSADISGAKIDEIKTL